MGGHVQIICITKQPFWVAFSVGQPHLVKRGGQFFKVEVVHEFYARIFDQLIQWQNFQLFEERGRVGSEGGITNYAYGLFLLFTNFFQLSSIFTTIEINAI